MDLSVFLKKKNERIADEIRFVIILFSGEAEPQVRIKYIFPNYVQVSYSFKASAFVCNFVKGLDISRSFSLIKVQNSWNNGIIS